MQFIRLCRSAATTDIIVGSGAATSTTVKLDATAFAFSPSASSERPWALGGPLGPGVALPRDPGAP